MPSIIERFDNYSHTKKIKRTKRTIKKIRDPIEKMQDYQTKRDNIQSEYDKASKDLEKYKKRKASSVDVISELRREKEEFNDARQNLLNELAEVEGSDSPEKKSLIKKINKQLIDLEKNHTLRLKPLISQLSSLGVLKKIPKLPKNADADSFTISDVTKLETSMQEELSQSKEEATLNAILAQHERSLQEFNRKIKKHSDILARNNEQYTDVMKFDEYMTKMRERASAIKLKAAEKRTKKALKNPNAKIPPAKKSKEELIVEAYEHFDENPNATIADFMQSVKAEDVGMKPESAEYAQFIKNLELRVTYVSESMNLKNLRETGATIRADSEERSKAALEKLEAAKGKNPTPDPNSAVQAIVNENKGKKQKNVLTTDEEETKKKNLALRQQGFNDLAVLLKSLGVRQGIIEKGVEVGKILLPVASTMIRNAISLMGSEYGKFKKTPMYEVLHNAELMTPALVGRVNGLETKLMELFKSSEDPNFTIGSLTVPLKEIYKSAGLLNLPIKSVDDGVKTVNDLLSKAKDKEKKARVLKSPEQSIKDFNDNFKYMEASLKRILDSYPQDKDWMARELTDKINRTIVYNNKLNTKFKEYNNKLQPLLKQLNETTNDADRKQLQKQIDEITSKIDDLSYLVYSSDFISDITNDRNKIKLVLDDTEINDLMGNTNKMTGDIVKESTDRVKGFNEKYTNYKNKLEKLSSDLVKLRGDLDKLNIEPNIKKELESNIEFVSKKINDESAKFDKYNQNIQESNNKIADINEQLKDDTLTREKKTQLFTEMRNAQNKIRMADNINFYYDINYIISKSEGIHSIIERYGRKQANAKNNPSKKEKKGVKVEVESKPLNDALAASAKFKAAIATVSTELDSMDNEIPPDTKVAGAKEIAYIIKQNHFTRNAYKYLFEKLNERITFLKDSLATSTEANRESIEKEITEITTDMNSKIEQMNKNIVELKAELAKKLSEDIKAKLKIEKEKKNK